MNSRALRTQARTKLTQSDRIAVAVAKAIKQRDRLSQKRIDELMKSLKKASKNVHKELNKLRKVVDVQQWQLLRMGTLKQLNTKIDGIMEELKVSYSIGWYQYEYGAVQLGMSGAAQAMVAGGAVGFVAVSDEAIKAIVSRSFTKINKKAVAFLADYDVQLMGAVTDELSSKIKSHIAAGLISGQSIDDISRGIGTVITDPATFKKAGKSVFKSAQSRTEMIVRTETNRAHNEGTKMGYRTWGVQKVRWLAAMDDRTCPRCASRDGRLYDIDKVDGPPLHPRCRCTVSPDLETRKVTFV